MIIRLVMLFFAAVAVVFGILFEWTTPIVVGALLHAFAGLCNLIRTYRIAKLVRVKKTPPEISTAEKVGTWIYGAISLTGLGLILFYDYRVE